MKRIKVILSSFFGVLSLVPALALAQTQTSGNFQVSQGLAGFLNMLRQVMSAVVPILIGLAVIVFLWGVLKFIFNAADPEKRKEGRSLMVWGIIGIVVMVSVWGLVIFVQNTFGVNTNTQHAAYPTI